MSDDGDDDEDGAHGQFSRDSALPVGFADTPLDHYDAQMADFMASVKPDFPSTGAEPAYAPKKSSITGLVLPPEAPQPLKRRSNTALNYHSASEWCDETRLVLPPAADSAAAAAAAAAAATGEPISESQWAELLQHRAGAVLDALFPKELIPIVVSYSFPLREIRFDPGRSSSRAGICNLRRSSYNQKYGWREAISEYPLKYYHREFAVRVSDQRSDRMDRPGTTINRWRPPGDVLVGVVRVTALPGTDDFQSGPAFGGDIWENPNAIGGVDNNTFCIDVATARHATDGVLLPLAPDAKDQTPAVRGYFESITNGGLLKPRARALGYSWVPGHYQKAQSRQISPYIYHGSVCRVRADLRTNTLSFRLVRWKTWTPPFDTADATLENDPPPTPVDARTDFEELDAGSWVIPDLAECHIFTATDGPFGYRVTAGLSIRSEPPCETE